MSRARDILQYTDYLNEEGAKLIVRIRDKRVQRKLVCPKFFKKEGMACLKLTASDARKISKLHKKAWKRKMRSKIKRIIKKRAISMGIRDAVIKIDDKDSGNE